MKYELKPVKFFFKSSYMQKNSMQMFMDAISGVNSGGYCPPQNLF